MSAIGGVAGTVTAGLRGIAAGSVAGVERAINEDHIRLAVTGLSRAGKTVFITSLIQNLLALGQGRNTLPKVTERLSRNHLSRLRGVEVLPAGAGVLPFFDQAAKLRDLAAAEPTWPPRTEDLAQISLALELERSSAIGQKLGTRRVRLDILDYPGEWLLDLPMLDQNYADWSEQTLALLRTPPRLQCAAAFLTFTRDLRPGDRAEESLLHKGHVLYREALHACRHEHGLRFLQPGRFICPGPGSDAPFLWFFPMEGLSGSAKPGSAAALLEQRFTAYQQHMRDTFFDTHFANFNRQIMLVDVLGALYGGKAAFEDTARAIQAISAALQYGGNGVARTLAAGLAYGWSQLLPSALSRPAGAAARQLGSGRIEHVVFAATKADHVPALRRDNLCHLLRALVDAGVQRANGGGAGVSHQVAASILSTTDGVGEWDGRPMEIVRGTLIGENKVRGIGVGDVPAGLPRDSYWSARFFKMPVFKPPPIDPVGTTGIPHLHLDLVLDAVIGDLL